MRQSIKVPFNALPKLTQRRLIEATHGAGPLLPLAAHPQQRVAVRALWALLAAAPLTALLLLLGTDAGRRGLAGAPPLAAVGYGALLGLAAYGILGLANSIRSDAVAPYRRGVYLFPTHWVCARAPNTLEVVPLSGVVGMRVERHVRRGGFAVVELFFGSGPPFSISVDRRDLGAVLEGLPRTLREIARAAADGRYAEVAARDIFYETRGTGLWSVPTSFPAIAAHA